MKYRNDGGTCIHIPLMEVFLVIGLNIGMQLECVVVVTMLNNKYGIIYFNFLKYFRKQFVWKRAVGPVHTSLFLEDSTYEHTMTIHGHCVQ
jgi:hypothetical protein